MVNHAHVNDSTNDNLCGAGMHHHPENPLADRNGCMYDSDMDRSEHNVLPQQHINLNTIIENHRGGMCPYLRDVREYLACDQYNGPEPHQADDVNRSRLEVMIMDNKQHLCPMVDSVYTSLACGDNSNRIGDENDRDVGDMPKQPVSTSDMVRRGD